MTPVNDACAGWGGARCRSGSQLELSPRALCSGAMPLCSSLHTEDKDRGHPWPPSGYDSALTLQRVQVQSLVQKNPTCHRDLYATRCSQKGKREKNQCRDFSGPGDTGLILGPRRPTSHRANEPTHLEPRSATRTLCTAGEPPPTTARESPHTATKTQHTQRTIKF